MRVVTITAEDFEDYEPPALLATKTVHKPNQETDSPKTPESTSLASKEPFSAPQETLDDEDEPKQKREKRWHTKLAHPGWRLAYDACPVDGFPEAEGGFCVECGWSAPIQAGRYVL